MLCYVMLCYVMLCYVMLCYVITALHSGISNYMARHSVARKDHIASLKVKVTIQTCTMNRCLFHIHILGWTAK